jgi:hypothetical protein
MKHARQDYDRIQDPAGLIPDEEPVFLIRGKDVAGPATVRAWARYAEEAGADQDIINAAYRQAGMMEDWQRTREKQVPDL